MNDNLEIWGKIDGWDGVYMVSNFGKVKSIPRYIPCKNGANRLTKESILKQQVDKFGYCRIGLHKNHKMKLCVVHRLVAKAFLPNPENKPCVNHINGNPSDNQIGNLEWCTYKENSTHAFKVLKRKVSGSALGISWPENKKGTNHHRYNAGCPNARMGESHPASKRIKCDTLDIEFISIKNAADLLGLNAAQVSNVLLGKYRQTHGLTFRYL